MPKSTPYPSVPLFDPSLFNELLAKLILDAQKNDVIRVELTLHLPQEIRPAPPTPGNAKPFSLASFLRAQAERRGENTDK
ncbi:MAG: hypothetical protein GY822_05390 [Deltaproteobacteria bacterium]|nr:hypothetical protein [Deltaproteobacteria bacterium]